MKKTILTVIAMLSLTLAHAENEDTNALNEVKRYDMTVNMDKLSESLWLSRDQREFVEDIHRMFCIDMLHAATAATTDREKKLNRAIRKDLSNMRSVLTERQYRRYLLILNTTIRNRGLR